MTTITLDESTVKWLVEAVEKEIRDAEEMKARAREVNCITAEQWSEGKRDGLIHAKHILRAAGISFKLST